MPRSSHPWFRTSKNAWYARIGNKAVSLGVVGKENRKTAYDAWHKFNTLGKPERSNAIVEELTDAFIQDAEGRVSPDCLRNYNIFASHLKHAFGLRRAEQITQTQVETFARKQQEWSSTYKHQFLAFAVSVYRWALRQRMLTQNPLAFVRRPPKASRGHQAIVSIEEHGRLLAKASPCFRDFLQLLWHTGARPSEIARLTAEQIRSAVNCAVVLAEHKTAIHGKTRILLFNDDAWAIVKRRADERQSGLLFEGLNGRLTAKAIGGRLRRLAEKVGLRNIIAYGYRHTYATDALSKGIPDAQVSALLGHASTSMLHRHYSHLTAKTALLREVAGRVR
jgi:integrase